VSFVRLASYDELFRRSPVGHYAVGEQFLVWCATRELCGMAVWGQPEVPDLRRVLDVFDHTADTGIAVPCDFVLDIRRLDRVDATLFGDLVREVGQRVNDIARRVRRHAIVLRPSELASAVVSGVYALVGGELRWRITDDLAAALAWFEHADLAVVTEVDRIVAECAAGSTAVDRLRGWLRDGGIRGTLEEAALALGLSARSLQRRLGDAGTSFRAELERARLAIAQQLLLDSDEKVAVIAAEVGSSSESNFIAFFRRVTGQTPAAWRAARRG
jgi:AraC-like DNA-binding protein